MALSQSELQKKRQKKQQKRSTTTKSKAASSGKPPQLLKPNMLGSSTIYDAWVSPGIQESGIGHVIISRINYGMITMVDFLVDTYCLGVKNTLIREETEVSYLSLINMMNASMNPLAPVEPSYAKKLVLEVVQYASTIGIAPHHDYHKLKVVFDDVDATECLVKFSFGQDGKPLLVQGPHDSPKQIKVWMNNLRNHCGDGEFDYILEVKKYD